jgi:TRAP-type C4-dicarboxylate transport system permease small subunit
VGRILTLTSLKKGVKKSKKQVMEIVKRLLISFVLFALAYFCYAFWAAGSHGHTKFRPHMVEDWIIVSLISFFTLIGLYFLFTVFRIWRGK